MGVPGVANYGMPPQMSMSYGPKGGSPEQHQSQYGIPISQGGSPKIYNKGGSPGMAWLGNRGDEDRKVEEQHMAGEFGRGGRF